MEIIKFGGSILKNKKGLHYLNEVLKKHKNKPILLIISAFSHVTRKLMQAAYLAEKGNEYKAHNIIESVISHYLNYSSEISNNVIKTRLHSIIIEGKVRLERLIKGVLLTRQLTARTLDSILSFGEYFALHTLFYYLDDLGFDISTPDAQSVVVTDENFGNAKPFLKKTKNNVLHNIIPLLKKHEIVIIQGFVARTSKGIITTMGMESSNLTAVLLADILKAEKVTFWTDVEGIRTADPKVEKNSKLIPAIDYETAYKLSLNGLKLINRDMISYAAKNNIKLIYRSAQKPDGENSIVSNKKLNLRNTIILSNGEITALNKVYKNDKDKFSGLNFLSSNHDFFMDKCIISPDSYSIYTSNQAIQTLTKKSLSDINIRYNISVITVIYSGKKIDYLKLLAEVINIKILFFEYDGLTNVIRIYTEKKYRKKLVNLIHKYYYD